MDQLQHVPVPAMDPRRFASVLPEPAYADLQDLIATGARELEGRVVWNINSTVKGGGVVEMLRPLVGYSRGAGVDARWAVISGSPEFFAITKRVHNNLHGFDGDGRGLGASDRYVYDRALADQAEELASAVAPQDIVILHDPQTIGLIWALKPTGAKVIWRCHVGLDQPNERARDAWRFLWADVAAADICVFSRAAYAWEGLPAEKVCVIHPSIDAFSPKNAEQTAEQATAILAASGIAPHRAQGVPTFVRSDGSPGRVDRRAEFVQEAPLHPEEALITQVSRWDLLKDPLGVLRGFTEHIADLAPGHLMLAGPSVASVTDDPEGAGVWATLREEWHGLTGSMRARVHLASLPMDDLEENAAIVNALQRHSSVVVQKSLAEGFGLTVSEAMWKSRPVVASRLGGIQDQIIDGQSGLLISDPHDLRAFGASVLGLLTDPSRATRMGEAARERVIEHYLGPAHLRRYMELFRSLIA